MIRRIRRMGYGRKLVLGYLVLISVPLLVVALAAYQTSTTTIEQNAQNFSTQLTGEIRDNLDTYAQQAERLTFWPFQASDVQAVLESYQRTPPQAPGLRDVLTMRGELSYLGHSRADISGIYVVTTDGTLFSWTASGDLIAHPRTTGALWYRRALAADPRPAFLPTGPQEMIAVATGQVFSVVGTLHDHRTGALLGAVRVDLDARALASVVQRVSLGNQGRLLVTGPAGEVVYPLDAGPDLRRLAGEIVAGRPGAAGRLQLGAGGQALLVSYDRSAASGWLVAGVVPTDRLLSGANHLRSLILTVAALCILAGVLGATLVVGRLTRPLRQLRSAMQRIEARGDFNTRVRVDSEDEVGQLAHSFNAMVDEIRRLVDDVLRAQIHEREAELRALQSQINPHFLYNTLESINMLALSHGDREISRMVTALGRLLRHTIQAGDALITLREELEYVNYYLVVQRMRYGDRITIGVEVDDALLAYLVPKLTIQPIVENALYHGLEPQRGAGRVVVRGRRDGDDLEITVEDDGVGMDAETLAAVRARLQQAASRGSRSVGLANVHHRLQLYCGAAYGLAVASEPGAGTRVTIRLPQVIGAQGAAAPALSAPR